MLANAPPLDIAGVLASVAAASSPIPIRLLKQNQPNISFVVPSTSAVGGCVTGCVEFFDPFKVELNLKLTFSYDEKSGGKLTGANIYAEIVSLSKPSASGRVYTLNPFPNLVFPPAQISDVTIDPETLRHLTQDQLRALAISARNQPNSIRDAILRALEEEVRRRAEEARVSRL